MILFKKNVFSENINQMEKKTTSRFAVQVAEKS